MRDLLRFGHLGQGSGSLGGMTFLGDGTLEVVDNGNAVVHGIDLASGSERSSIPIPADPILRADYRRRIFYHPWSGALISTAFPGNTGQRGRVRRRSGASSRDHRGRVPRGPCRCSRWPPDPRRVMVGLGVRSSAEVRFALLDPRSSSPYFVPGGPSAEGGGLIGHFVADDRGRLWASEPRSGALVLIAAP
jgi:hypothetical protein